MPYLATCTFREKAKNYYLDPGELNVGVDDRVVAFTARGLELGRVKWAPREIPQDTLRHPPGRIERLATQQDLQQDEANRALELEALEVVRERIVHFGLPMRVVHAECLLDRSRLFVFYESEERVDFRDLLRDLSSRLRVRVQLQGVNAREAAKLIGGLGVCGQPLCCSTWLTHLPPVTLKMAKEQGVGAVPSKISGSCGRLMCCLRYEIDFYRDQSIKMPTPGTPVDTPEGPGHVVDVNFLSEMCVVRLGDGRHLPFSGDTLREERAARGPVRACSNHINHGGSCTGASGGGCSSGGCGSKGKSGGCGSGGCGGCAIKKKFTAKNTKEREERGEKVGV